MESAPQSTIAHNAVIEFASDLDLHPTPRRGSGGRIKRRPALPKRAALNRRDHAKIICPAQRRGGHKKANSAGISAEIGPIPGLTRNLRAAAVAVSEIQWIGPTTSHESRHRRPWNNRAPSPYRRESRFDQKPPVDRRQATPAVPIRAGSADIAWCSGIPDRSARSSVWAPTTHDRRPDRSRVRSGPETP